MGSKGSGRTKLSAEKKKTNTISISFTDSELTALENGAGEFHFLKINDYLRYIIFKDELVRKEMDAVNKETAKSKEEEQEDEDEFDPLADEFAGEFDGGAD